MSEKTPDWRMRPPGSEVKCGLSSPGTHTTLMLGCLFPGNGGSCASCAVFGAVEDKLVSHSADGRPNKTQLIARIAKQKLLSLRQA